MKAIRRVIGFILIIMLLSGLGYIGWFVSKSGLIAWNSFETPAKETSAHSAHSGHSAIQPSEEAPGMQVNPVNELQKKVAGANEAVKQMADWMSEYPYAIPASAATYSNSGSGGTGGQVDVQHPIQIQNGQRGIYLLSESVYLLNQLDQMLASQAGLTESAAPAYQMYVNRYNLLIQSKATLNNVNARLNNAKDLFLSNISGAPAAYGGPDDIRQTNKAIYQLAQTVMEMDSLNRWVSNQMEQTVVQARNLANAEASNTVSDSQSNGFSIKGIPMPGLMTTIAAVFVVLLAVALIGMIRSLVAARPEPVNTEDKT
ncbi:flagellar basal body-associated protein FliL [Paenibacillus forsythiae]|uniref:Flagellar basal body-associated protein FliL n=1 Tax=Paenibacillus forsythiae TaxID=365616 RepID=A0ABU3HAR0_9BACL|nr:hypothetical protein [Paenibacillus forsythiae]MDT3427916.1 flagellar basal body-associated protein FliL [Paenibacillus forsythiae]